MNLSIPASTWVCLIIIAAVFFILWYLINKWKKEDKLLEHRRIVEYFPTAVSTLGVLGTFFGITMGLVAFDSGNLDQSIPGLLDGLKTAFFTSLAGMIGSMILWGSGVIPWQSYPKMIDKRYMKNGRSDTPCS